MIRSIAASGLSVLLGIPLLLVTLGSAGCAPARPSAELAPQNRTETVVLVHGLGRSRLSMLPLELSLEREGYRVVNWGYSSVSATIPELGAALAARVAEQQAEPAAGRIHFVGHSLGNIIIRWALANQPPPRLGRVVMLAPPNQGAASADRYAPWLGWVLRPLPELTTDSASTARTTPVPDAVEIGIIAAEQDAKVSVEETRLAGAKEHIVVGGYHTFLMAQPSVQELVIRFLRTGTFAGQ